MAAGESAYLKNGKGNAAVRQWKKTALLFTGGIAMIRAWLLAMIGLMMSFATLAADRDYILGVDGLACPFCAYGIEKRLEGVEGVASVEVHIVDSVVHVTMDQGMQLTEARAREAVEEAGFTLRSFSSRASGAGGNDES